MIDLDKLDVRTAHRHIRKGLLTQEQYDKYLASLPDVAADAEFVDYTSQFATEAAAESEDVSEGAGAEAAEQG